MEKILFLQFRAIYFVCLQLCFRPLTLSLKSDFRMFCSEIKPRAISQNANLPLTRQRKQNKLTRLQLLLQLEIQVQLRLRRLTKQKNLLMTLILLPQRRYQLRELNLGWLVAYYLSYLEKAIKCYNDIA